MRKYTQILTNNALKSTQILTNAVADGCDAGRMDEPDIYFRKK